MLTGIRPLITRRYVYLQYARPGKLAYSMERFCSSSDEKEEKSAARTPSSLSGVVASAVTATAGFQIASFLTSSLAVPVSGIPVAILLGAAIRNTVGVNQSLLPGVKYATKTILQGGIIAVAAKLSFVELLSTGSQGLPVVIASVGAGLAFIPIAGKFAGLPKEMTLLLTAGTSICGVTAITALAPAINASNRDIAVAVANTVAFGTVGMICYPYLFNLACTSSEQVGMCLGVAIHDTSQVLGSAMSYKETFSDELALKVAAVTKLTRNLGLAIAIPGLTYFHSIEQRKKLDAADVKQHGDTISGLATFQKYVPSFLIAFIGMSSLRSCGDFFLVQDAETFQKTMDYIGNDVSKYALGTAMAGVGLSTSASSLKGVGWKPFAVGASGAMVVGGTGFMVSSLIV
mmetsp:Transcript_62009/g.72511  ORF Transcript_62009/g.72511 Transcript_62009/m.72511 type:complete len:403 (-) Transcript_62009:26-1234(-)